MTSPNLTVTLENLNDYIFYLTPPVTIDGLNHHRFNQNPFVKLEPELYLAQIYDFVSNQFFALLIHQTNSNDIVASIALCEQKANTLEVQAVAPTGAGIERLENIDSNVAQSLLNYFSQLANQKFGTWKAIED